MKILNCNRFKSSEQAEKAYKAECLEIKWTGPDEYTIKTKKGCENILKWLFKEFKGNEGKI